MPAVSSQALALQQSGLNFSPPPRARSEASFSEFHYDHTHQPPAGVCSKRLWELMDFHKEKDCSKDYVNRVSKVQEVIRMTPEQEHNAQFERLDGPRLDPAKIRDFAGDMSQHTKTKVTLLGNHDHGSVAKANKGTRARGFIMDISRKASAVCSPPPRSTDPLRPAEEKYNRLLKRHGYKTKESSWTWNECHEVTGQDPRFVDMHNPEVVLDGLSPVKRRVYTSVKGEKKYNVCGAQDMLPWATKLYAQSDAPPSARHIYENDKRHLQGFERGVRPKGVNLEACAVEYLGESPEMWNCMQGYERPVDKWRAMSARTGQPMSARGRAMSVDNGPNYGRSMDRTMSADNFMDSAESYYAANENTRSTANRYPATLSTPRQQGNVLYSRSAGSLGSPTGSSMMDRTYQSNMDQGDTARRKDNRRSVLSTPSDGGSRVSRRDSRASVTSSGNRRWR